MKNKIKEIFSIFVEKIGIAEIVRMISMDRQLSIAKFYNDYLFNNKKYSESDRLNKYEFSVYSQGGDDGIIHEIFRRIGTTNKMFVEFGVGDGLQNNTANLLLSGWSGLWIDGSTDYFNKIKNNLKNYLDNKLVVINSMVYPDNVEKLFTDNKVKKDIDFLSIDIDGNDYWVWKSIVNFSPRVVVLEYNASYGPHISITQKYYKDYFWKRTNFYGSSLSGLNNLAKEKGYSLVACSFLGNNAYFVRNDLVFGKFNNTDPIYLYESHKPFLLQKTKYQISFIENQDI